MIVILMAVAVSFGSGVWLLVASVWPAPPPLDKALERLHAPASPKRRVSDSVNADSTVLHLGARLLDHVRGDFVIDERVDRDLAVTHRPVELYAGMCAVAAIAGAVLGPALWMLVALAGTHLPLVVPVWLMMMGGVAGFLAPRVLLRAQAKRARSDFLHALGAYLDILVLLLAANHGPEGAMREAALAGTGPAFTELRRATTQAQYSGAIWDALDDLGERIGVSELREIAAAGILAGERGAAVRKSLVAKARSLRSSTLSANEANARSRSQAMFGPILLMGCGFVVFLLFPLLTNLEIG